MSNLTEIQNPELLSTALYPLLPLRDIVIFPHMVTPLFVGRARSIHALEQAMEGNKLIFLTTQKDPKVDDPDEVDIYQVGTIGHIVQMLKLPDGTIKVLIEGKQRSRIKTYIDQGESLQVEADLLEQVDSQSSENEALMRGVINVFESYINLSKKVPTEVMSSIAGVQEAGRLADLVVAHLQVSIVDRQDILETYETAERLEKLLAIMEREVEILQIEKKIRGRVKRQMERSQKEYYLNEQMRAIQKELGDKDEFKQELLEIEEKLRKKKLSKDATEKVEAELRKLKTMSPMSAEATVVRNYIDWLLSIPWRERSKSRLDVDKAEEILEEDHYGLEKVKERIIEYLAVQALVRKLKGPILCLVGPPGVGKTSLGRSVARALNRKFVRMSLGGVRDEAEIRGHRRTYIGAMPGKIIQGMRKAAVRNPVFLLDEVDKMSTDFRGDPSSALLEVLDPEQNSTFGDHFLDVDYDLSQVLFIATANTLQSIPAPLYDRMEVIRVEGYTEEEKLNIARKYLLPKQLLAHGLKEDQVTVTDEALYEVIRRYTREAGVRSLERELASICRKLARDLVKVLKTTPNKAYTVDFNSIKGYLGVSRFQYGTKDDESRIGMATGLAWTEVGGEILTIETVILTGSGKLTVTGKLGEVMNESAHAALSYVRSRWQQLGIQEDFYQKIDIHIHVPEGAIPKDGPSAGITMATALASALTGRSIDCGLAMTGEITLRGRVLPIGGLKEKLLAAKRAGITRVLIPAENEKNLDEISEKILKDIDIKVVSHVDEVLEQALSIRLPLSPLGDNMKSASEQIETLHH
jgi:ATP-dependent Lon protease